MAQKSQNQHQSQKNPNHHLNHKKKEYSLLFEPFLPLGFYCTTQILHNKSICKITSLNPNAKNVSKLQLNTIITASSIIVGTVVVKKMDVLNHNTLQRCYGIARKKGNNCKLRLFFVNDEKGDKNCEADWNEFGCWKGEHDPSIGWAGGASLAKLPLVESDTTILIQKPQVKEDLPT